MYLKFFATRQRFEFGHVPPVSDAARARPIAETTARHWQGRPGRNRQLTLRRCRRLAPPRPTVPYFIHACSGAAAGARPRPRRGSVRASHCRRHEARARAPRPVCPPFRQSWVGSRLLGIEGGTRAVRQVPPTPNVPVPCMRDASGGHLKLALAPFPDAVKRLGSLGRSAAVAR
jgi:hypothetical protein